MNHNFTRLLGALSWLLVLGLVFPYQGKAQIAISTNSGSPNTENFVIGTSATASLPADWRAGKDAANVRTVGTYAAAVSATEQRAGNSMSGSASNGIYNYAAGDATTVTERALGFISSGSATKSGNLYARFRNTSANPLTSLNIAYDVEKYRDGTNAAGFSIQLYYSTDGSTWTSAGASFLTSFPGADPVNAGFTTAPGATVNVSNTLAVNIPAGSDFYLAWNYSVTSGTTTSNAQGLGIDNFSMYGIEGSGTTPTINASASAADFRFVPSGSSKGTSYTLSGSNLTNDIDLALTGSSYQISKDSSSWGTVLTYTVAEVATSPKVYVRFSPTADGAAAGSILHTSTGASNVTVNLTGTGYTPAQLIISQYYEGLSNNKWLEITNTGSTTANLAGYYVVLYTNPPSVPVGVTPGSNYALTGTLAPGASLIFRNGSAVLPENTNITGTPITSSVCGFNGNDIVALSLSTGAFSWADRVDVVGTTGTWGQDISLYRNANVTAGNVNYTSGEWSQVGNDIVDGANSTQTEQIGVHIYEGGTLPFISTNPSSLSFGGVVIGNNSTLSYQLRAGNLAGGIVTVDVQGGTEYQVSRDGIAFGDTVQFASAQLATAQTVYVRFAPSATGILSSTLQVSDGTSSVTVNLSGIGQVASVFAEDFEGCPTVTFTAVSVAGAQVWGCTSFGNNSTTGYQMNGFSGSAQVNEDWLVSPAYDLSGISNNAVLQFYSISAFAGNSLELYITTNYTGNPATTVWQQLDGRFPAPNSSVWTLSQVDLNAYKTSNVRIAFRYTSTSTAASRWTLDDIAIISSTTPVPAALSTTYSALQNYIYGFTNVGAPTAGRSFLFKVSGADTLTVTAPEGFELSTNDLAYLPQLTFGSTALADTQTLYVRFAPATAMRAFAGGITFAGSGLNTTLGYFSGTTFPADSSFDVVTWNIEWFGSTGNGPGNETLQRDNAIAVLNILAPEVIVVEEISDTVGFDNLVAALRTGTGRDYVGTLSRYTSNTYSDNNQRVGFIYDTSFARLAPVSALLPENPRPMFKSIYSYSSGANFPGYPGGDGTNFWASGRLPYMIGLDVTIGGNTQRVYLVAVHAKANTNPLATSYTRRVYDNQVLKDTLDFYFGGENVMLLGDYNDDLDVTVNEQAGTTASSYAALVNDSLNYEFPSLALSNAGLRSYVDRENMIDHIMHTNEMQRLYISGSVNVFPPDYFASAGIANYTTTTSDHLPVMASYDLRQPLTRVQYAGPGGSDANPGTTPGRRKLTMAAAAADAIVDDNTILRIAANGTYPTATLTDGVTVEGYASEAYTTRAAVTVGALTVNASGKTVNLDSDLSASTLDLVAGNVATGSNILAVTSTDSTAIASGAGWVNGSLRRYLAPATPYTFPVGSAAAQQTFEVRFDSIIVGPSYLTVTFNSTAPSTQGFPLNDAGRLFPAAGLLDAGYWTVTPNVPLTGGTYSARGWLTGATNDGLANYILVKRDGPGQPWTNAGVAGAFSEATGTVSVSRSGLTGFSEFGFGGTNSPLPVELLSFDARVQNRMDALLTWATASELNNEGFIVEHSRTPDNFRPMGFVAGAGTTTEQQSYRFTARELGSGRHYFRLVQRDHDGTTYVKGVREVFIDLKDALLPLAEVVKVYPVPTRDQLTIELLEDLTNVRAELTNVHGQVVRLWLFNGDSFRQVDDLPAGIYFLHLKAADGRATTLRIVKQ